MTIATSFGLCEPARSTCDESVTRFSTSASKCNLDLREKRR